MTTAYPSGLDSWTNPTGVSNLSDVPVLHSAAHANLNDAVEALEAELGLLPKGGSASVRARLDALDTTVAAKALASRTISAGTGLTGGGDLSTNRTLTVDLEYLQDQVAAMLVAGTNVTLSYNDAAGTLTINATGGGGGSSNPLPLGRATPSTGAWVAGRVPGISEVAGLNVGKSIGACHVVPFMSRAGFTADRIGIGAHSNGDATLLCRLGIYADDGNFYPGSRILDAGTVAGNAVSATAAVTISQALSANTLYWLVMAFQGTVTTYPNIKASGSVLISGLADIGLGTQDQLQNSTDEWFYMTGITGALPATFPARSTASMINQAPVITLRSA